MSSSILFVISAATHWTLADATRQPTGFWAEEALGPYHVFKDAGHRITVATPGAVVPTPDPVSLGPDANGGDDGARAMREAYEAAGELRAPIALTDVDAADHLAVFYPGGWAPMEDLSHDADSAALLRRFHQARRPVSFVCHGPAALLPTAHDAASPWQGYRLTGLSNAEERANGLADRAKWLLQDRLVTDLDADYREGPAFEPHVEVDRLLYTGQNPASAVPLAERLLRDLPTA